jgi:hypothetical protein
VRAASVRNKGENKVWGLLEVKNHFSRLFITCSVYHTKVTNKETNSKSVADKDFHFFKWKE